VQQHEFEKQHVKMAKQAAELRLARDEVQPSTFSRPPPLPHLACASCSFVR
jgi:hypothetical protein